MKFTSNELIHGFKLTNTRHVEELSGDLHEFEHVKTGAQLCWLDNCNENKLFSITFKTLPENDTGVFHILEHSVLNGSRKYPVREPFVELLKSSMNTFLNAMTFSDKTMYPVSSKNETDFMNLVSVYLDGVFFPNILNNPNIFYQEGHHTELLSIDAVPSFKGVVFNEMKGATSSVDSIIGDRIQRELFPDNCYKWNSGGDPVYIPDLTYDHFIDTYHRYYHPSNARIYLDGSVPFMRLLEVLDSEYLCHFGKNDSCHEIINQIPVETHEICNDYELSPNEELEGKAHFSFGKIAASWDDPVKVAALNILFEYLTGSNDAPLKRTLLDSGLCEDVSLYLSDGVQQPWYVLQVQNMNDGDRDEILSVIRTVLQDLVKNGTHKKAIEAAINRMEFSNREPKEPLGVYHAINAMNGWLYGGDPLLYLTYEDVFKSLRSMLNDNSYERLIQEALLDETGIVYLRTLPSYDRGERMRAEEAARAAAEVNAMTDEQKQELVKLNEKLVEWQQTPESPEELATIPQLDISEVSPEPVLTPVDTYTCADMPVIFHEQPCPGITHVTMMFRLTDYTLSELCDAALASSMYGELPTSTHDVEDLQTEIKLKTGRMNFNVDIFAVKKHPELCIPVLSVSFSCLESAVNDSAALILEILNDTDFSEKEKIREMVMQEDYYSKTSIEGAGHSVAIGRASAHYLATAAVNDAIGGVAGYRQLHNFAEHFDSEFDSFKALTDKLHASLCRSRMIISVTATHEIDVSSLICAFENGTPVAENVFYKPELANNEGFSIPSQISFAGYAMSPLQYGMQYNGSGNVAAQILSLDYLWNKVRVQGGAYGGGTAIRANNTVVCYSYRDPSPVNSIETFRSMPDYLREFCETRTDLEKYIISSVSETEPLRTPFVKGRIATAEYLSGVTAEDKRRYRREMLATRKEDLLMWADTLEKGASDAAVCIIGFADALALSDDLTIEEL